MPSPIAHLAVGALLLPPLLEGVPRAARVRRIVLALGLAGLLVAPDLDIALGALLHRDAFGGHGTWTHSLVMAAVLGVTFAVVARLFGVPLGRGMVVGLLGALSHVILDALTRGRGIWILWPFVEGRMGSPVPLFVGVFHPHWMRFDLHLLTLANELLFAGACVLAARRLARHRTVAAP